jgi:hypothetical protein
MVTIGAKDVFDELPHVENDDLGFERSTCICGHAKCKIAMALCLPQELRGYLELPNASKNEDQAPKKGKVRPAEDKAKAAVAAKRTALREGSIRHMFANVAHGDVENHFNDGAQQCRIAKCHFSREVLEHIGGRKWVSTPPVPHEVGKALGFTDVDLVDKTNPGLGFWPLPNMGRKAQMDTIRIAAAAAMPADGPPSPLRAALLTPRRPPPPSAAPMFPSPPSGQHSSRTPSLRGKRPCREQGVTSIAVKPRAIITPRPAFAQRKLQQSVEADPAAAAAQLAAALESIRLLQEQLVTKDTVIEEMKLAASAREAEAMTWSAVCGMFRKEGGICRATLTSDDWHRAHPTAAKHLFGFEDWGETIGYIYSLFKLLPPEHLEAAEHKKRKRSGSAWTPPPLSTKDMTDFEKCLLTKMLFRRG